MNVCAPPVPCMSGPQGAEQCATSPGTTVPDVYEPLWWYCELIPGLLQEQPVL